MGSLSALVFAVLAQMPPCGESAGLCPAAAGHKDTARHTGMVLVPDHGAPRLYWHHNQGQMMLRLRGGVGKIQDVRSVDAFSKEDQMMINRYAGLNFRKQELLELLKEKEEEADGLRSAADEILLAGLDGPEDFQEQRSLPPGIDFRWGETFSEWSPERAQEELDYRLEMNQLTQDDLTQEIAEIEETMSGMKEVLKGKFGDQVVLDDDDDDEGDETTHDLSDASDDDHGDDSG